MHVKLLYAINCNQSTLLAHIQITLCNSHAVPSFTRKQIPSLLPAYRFSNCKCVFGCGPKDNTLLRPKMANRDHLLSERRLWPTSYFFNSHSAVKLFCIRYWSFTVRKVSTPIIGVYLANWNLSSCTSRWLQHTEDDKRWKQLGYVLSQKLQNIYWENGNKISRLFSYFLKAGGIMKNVGTKILAVK